VVFPLGQQGWVGRAAFLQSIGWGLAVVYRPAAAHDVVTRASGAGDARDAVARWRSEGLPVGTTCFLDLHDIAAGACLEYCRGWIGALLDSGVLRPGVCCVPADMLLLRRASRAELDVPLWVVGTGYSDASIVERPVRVMGESHGDVGLHVRHCVARAGDPSRPGAVLALRDLVDQCLVIVRAAHMASAEMDVTARDGETTLRLRIVGRAGRR
jgi:hypothetical protein